MTVKILALISWFLLIFKSCHLRMSISQKVHTNFHRSLCVYFRKELSARRALIAGPSDMQQAHTLEHESDGGSTSTNQDRCCLKTSQHFRRRAGRSQVSVHR